MNKEQIDELQKELQNNLGSRWKVEPTSQVKVGGVKFGFTCSFEGDNASTIIYWMKEQTYLKWQNISLRT